MTDVGYCEHGVPLDGGFPCLFCHPEVVSEASDISEYTSSVDEKFIVPSIEENIIDSSVDESDDEENPFPKDFDFEHSSLSDGFISKIKLRVAKRKIDELRKMVGY